METDPEQQPTGGEQPASQDQLTPDEQIASLMQAKGHQFPVVGIGASAGGLKALASFFESVPPDSGLAYVVILHLSPDYESHLPSVIGQDTDLPVVQVNESVKIEPNKVYVIPPNKYLSMSDGRIDLTDAEKTRGRRVPIDVFFRTLAESHGPFAGAVVLSGSGTDGTVGLARVKEYAGVVAAQDPRDAEYPEMPRSAINTALVDYVLPASQIPSRMISYWRAAGRIQLPPPEEPRQLANPSTEEAVREILSLLRSHTGHDFSEYKRSTILRRIARRMQVHDTESVVDYLNFVRSHLDELPALEGELLISVTNFFRDHDAYDMLAAEIIPELFEDKYPSDTIRVWVAGCATGEEAYSVAMLLREHADTLSHPPGFQIFATDIDEQAIQAARDAVYPESISTDVSLERLSRFFVKEQNGYRIKKDIRESVLFAVHNVLRDPPFSRLDLITCRNLLIYLTRNAQAQVLDTFHFALKPDGYLFLGTSETVEGTPRLFLPIGKREHIFERLNVQHFGQFANVNVLPRISGLGRAARPPVFAQKTPDVADLHRNLIEQYGPPSVLIDRHDDIVHASLNANRFLTFAPGEPSNNLLRVVVPELRMELRAALYSALGDQDVEIRQVSVQLGGDLHLVNLSICKVREPAAAEGLRLVIFDDIGLAPKGAGPGATEEAAVVQHLEAELLHTKEQLRVLVEQYETSMEELKASNEELQAINEELRSTTEELETSKEELQAVNEEMHTVNQELKQKVEEVSWANNDLQNLLASTNIATIFLGKELQIKRFTPQMRDLFNIIPSDLNRPLSHVTHHLKYYDLVADSEHVVRRLTPIEREIESEDGRWFLVRLMPYRTAEDRIDGVVIAFIDITERKRVEQEREALIRQLEDERARFEALVEQIPASLTVAEAPSGKLIYVSRRATNLWGRAIHDVESIEQYQKVFSGSRPDGTEYKPQDWPLARAVRKGQEVFNEEVTLTATDGQLRNMLISALPVRDREGRIILGVSLWLDNTVQTQTEEHLRQANQELDERSAQRADELQDISARLKMEEQNQAVRVELMRQLVTAQEEERRRISRELHDELGQLLTGLKFLLDTAARQPDSRTEQIVEAKSVVDTAMSRIREISANLRPSVLDDVGLLPAFINLIDRFTAQTGVHVTFRHEGLEGRFPPDVETAVYRVVQEALTNVARHSQVSEASVSVLADSSLLVVVEDRGTGFDADSSLAEGFGHGLAGMRERLRLVGGDLIVESTPGSGTKVTAEVPLKPPPAPRGKRKKTEG